MRWLFGLIVALSLAFALAFAEGRGSAAVDRTTPSLDAEVPSSEEGLAPIPELVEGNELDGSELADEVVTPENSETPIFAVRRAQQSPAAEWSIGDHEPAPDKPPPRA